MKSVNKEAYREIIESNLKYLESLNLPHSLELEHIKITLRQSIDFYYRNERIKRHIDKMKLKKIDPYNLPKGEVLAKSITGLFIEGKLYIGDNTGNINCRGKNCIIYGVTHYIALSEIEYE